MYIVLQLIKTNLEFFQVASNDDKCTILRLNQCLSIQIWTFVALNLATKKRCLTQQEQGEDQKVLIQVQVATT
jgi:hypothetical protein